MEDWLLNSGLVGFYNILKESKDEITLAENYLEFNPIVLENFEEKYFNYFINKYKETLSWYKIVSFKDFIEFHEKSQFKEFNEKSLQQLNDYISKVAKYYLKSDSYVAAYPLINNNLNILALENSLSSVKLKRKEKIEDIEEKIKDTFQVLNKIIDYMELSESKKYLAAKNVIYTIINNGWDGVCFLNRRTKEKDMYVDYREYFIKPILEYLSIDKSKFKYNCFICGESMKDFNNHLSFINNTGFDVNKKSSHVWDFNNDVATCPICRLIYTCIPAGFTYVYNEGIYINDNSSIESAINVNNKIKNEILKEHEINRSLTYRALVDSIEEQFKDSVKYELVDIQVVRYSNNNYIFNIMTKKMLEIIHQSKDNLNSLVKGNYKEINTYFNIYDLVIDSLLNNQNLNLIIHKLLVYKLSIPRDCYYSINQVVNVMNINYRFMRGIGYMENLDRDIVRKANQQGYFLRQEYKGKKAEGKMSGISYRLLNALKVNSKDMFMDTVLNCYLYVQRPVPQIILEGLKDDVVFKTVGYAFVSGLIEGKSNNEQGGKVNEG